MKTEDLNIDNIMKTVSKSVARVPGHYFEACFGREDLVQQICITVLAKAGDHDKKRSKWKTYLDRIIKIEIKNFFLGKRSMKNKAMVSLDDCDSDASLAELLVYNDPPPGEPDMFEKLIYASEQQEAIDKMPERMRDICEMLKHYSVTETMNELGLSASVFYRELEKIRTLFIEDDLVPDHILEFFEKSEKNQSENGEISRSAAI